MLSLAMILLAVNLTGPADNPALEAKAKEIEGKLIAPCCWSQPVSQHYSEVTDKIRAEIREMLAAGKTEQEILDIYASAYGERILASPRARGFNLLVYVLPWLALLAGAAILITVLKKWRTSATLSGNEAKASPALIDPAYAARLEQELRDID